MSSRASAKHRFLLNKSKMNYILLFVFLFLFIWAIIVFMRPKPKHIPSYRVVEEIKVESPPSIYEALNKLLEAYGEGEEVAVIELARIYMFGLHPFFLPNKIAAGQICNFVIYGDQFSKVAKVKAKELFLDLKYADIPLQDRNYIPLPENPVETLANIKVKLPMVQMKAMNLPVQVQDDNFFNLDDIDIDTQAALFAQFAPPVQNDAQNVHSSTVQHVANLRLQNIEKDIGHINQGYSQSFFNWLSTSDLSREQKDNVREVIASFSMLPHSRYGRSEKDVFETVWARVNAPVNRDRYEDMAKVFAESIASSLEHDHVVCSTGKIVRMIGSLDGMDAEPEKMGGDLKPEWALDAEMAGIASVIREEVLNKAPVCMQNAYNDGTDTLLENEMKKTLKDRLQKEYVDSSLLSQEAVDLKYDLLAEGF